MEFPGQLPLHSFKKDRNDNGVYLMGKGYKVFLLAVISILGIGVLLFSTIWGIGISPDSTVYITAARNLSNGLGYTQVSSQGELIPVRVFLPLYPALLSVFGVFGIDPLQGARGLHSFLFGINIFLAGFLVYRYTHGSLWASLLCSFLFLFSNHMLYIHSVALTEPLFVFLGLLGLFGLTRHIENPKPLLLLGSSLAMGLAFFTRYPGIVWIPASMVGLFLLSKKTARARITDCLVFGFISGLPVALWSMRNLILFGDLTNRKMAFHLITLGHIRSALNTLSMWLLPSEVPETMRWIFLGVAAGALFLSIAIWVRKDQNLRNWDAMKSYIGSLPFLLAAFILCYGIFLIVSISFFDALVQPNRRVLSPVFAAGLILALCIGHRLYSSYPKKGVIQVTILAISIVLLGSYICRGTKWILNVHESGQGYASKTWKESEIIEKIRNLPAEIYVYSNGADAILAITGRPTHMLPFVADPITKIPNDYFSAQIGEIHGQIKNRSAVWVWFDRITWRWYYPPEKELQESLCSRVIHKGSDGSIYGFRE